jgi:hypothetical protein
MEGLIDTGRKIGLDDVELQELTIRLARLVDRAGTVGGVGDVDGEEEEVRLSPEPDWPTLGEDAFCGLAGEVVRTLEPHTEADPVALLAEFLALYGNCVGIGPHFRIGATRHPAKLFVILVGDTARARKDTARIEVSQVFSLVDPDWMSERQIRGLGSGEGLIEKVKDPPPPEDEEPDDDEGLAANSEDDDEVIARGWQSLEPDLSVDKRFVVVESEWSRMLVVAQREGSTLAQTICTAWDTDVLAVTTRKRSVHAKNCHIALLGHITLEGLRRMFTKAEAMEGFGNRFLLFLVRNSKELPDGGWAGHDQLSALARKVRGAVRRAHDVHGPLYWTDKAQEIWDQYYRQMAKDNPGGLLGGMVARNQPQVLRLALIYALLDYHDGTIDVPHLKAAIAVWEYCRASTAYIFGDATGDAIAEQIKDELRMEWPDGLDRNSICHTLFNGNVNRRLIDVALQTLQRMGLIKIVADKTGKRGRPRRVVYLTQAP